MAVIRVPEEAKPLLRLCRKHDLAPTEIEAKPCFETYADLMVFAASYGFSELGGKPPQRKQAVKFLDRPNPIDLSIFKTDKRYPQILLIALATSKDQKIVRDEELICKLIEDYVASGCQKLVRIIGKDGAGREHIELATVLSDVGDDKI
jgi:dnd system-associated protein 4